MNVSKIKTVKTFLLLSTFVFVFGVLVTPTFAQESQNGSITICKAIINTEGVVVDGSEKPGTFSIEWIENDKAAGVLPDTEFKTPLNFNNSPDDIDIECITYSNLSLGEYYYNQERIEEDEDWDEPKYNDQFDASAHNMNDLFLFSGAQEEADGRVVLTAERPYQTLVVLNRQLPKLPQCSDEKDNDGDRLADTHDPACHTDGDSRNSDSYDPKIDTENSPPVLLLVGSPVYKIHAGESYLERGARAFDFEEGNISDKIVVNSDAVNVNVAGVQIVTYNVKDSGGMAAEELTREVNVSALPAPPVFIDGSVGGAFRQCSDRIDNDGDGLVDYIEDVGGCSAYYDHDENDAPEIIINGRKVVKVLLGTAYTDPGAVALDLEEGDITARMIVDNTVDTNVEGTYTITYNVEDLHGLVAEQVTRTVHVGFEGGAECGLYVEDFLRGDLENDSSQVLKLQKFFNDFEGSTLEETGEFDEATLNAVRDFQTRYSSDILEPWGISEPSGYVYITTRKKINEIYCADQGQKQEFTLTADQQREIDEFRVIFERFEELGAPEETIEELRGQVGLGDTEPVIPGEETPSLAVIGGEDDSELVTLSQSLVEEKEPTTIQGEDLLSGSVDTVAVSGTGTLGSLASDAGSLNNNEVASLLETVGGEEGAEEAPKGLASVMSVLTPELGATAAAAGVAVLFYFAFIYQGSKRKRKGA